LPNFQAGPKANLSTQRTLAASHLRRGACFPGPGPAVCHLTSPKTNKISTNLAFDRPTRRLDDPDHTASEDTLRPVGPLCGYFVTRRLRDNRLPTRQLNRPEDHFRQLGRPTRRYLGPAPGNPKVPCRGRRSKCCTRRPATRSSRPGRLKTSIRRCASKDLPTIRPFTGRCYPEASPKVPGPEIPSTSVA